MRVLITGGGGFIGSHILKALLNQDAYIVNYDLTPLSQNAASEVLSSAELSAVQSVVGDITDFPALCRTMKEHQITHIVHLAAVLNDVSKQNPYLASHIMNTGMLNVLEAARIIPLKRIVWASSMSVFDNHAGDYVENDTPHNTNTVYGACKSWAEKMSEHYYRMWQIDTIGLRFGVTYGPGRLRGITRFATDIIRQPLLREPFTFEFGNSRFDWQYVGDLAQATSIVLQSEHTPTSIRAYNLRGEEASVFEVSEAVKKFIPGANIQLGNGHLRINPTGNDTLFQEQFGYKCSTNIESAIKKMKEHMNLYSRPIS